MHFQHQNYQNSSNWFRQWSASLQGWNLPHLQPSEETRVRAGIGASLKSRGFAIRKADFKLYGPLAPLHWLPVNTFFVFFFFTCEVVWTKFKSARPTTVCFLIGGASFFLATPNACIIGHFQVVHYERGAVADRTLWFPHSTTCAVT